jgi:hypothetical protein
MNRFIQLKTTTQPTTQIPSMKKKSTSRSAFLNLRVLFGLFVMLAGVFLALVSFGTFSSVFAQNGTTREQMALTLAQALAINPPACVPGQEMFNDVPASSPFCPFIEELARRGVTGGCGGGNYCPSASVTRAQMAAFLVKITQSEAFHIVGAPGEPLFGNGGAGDCLWQNPPLGIPLIGAANPASFFKDSDGIVHLAGLPLALNGPGGDMTCDNSDVSDNVIFVLPAGYQPKHLEIFVSGNSSIALNLVIPEGGLMVNGQFIPGGSVLAGSIADTGATTLDGFTFRAAPAATASKVSRQPTSISLEDLRNLLGRGSASRALDGRP